MPDPTPDDMTIDGDVFVVVTNAEGVHAIWPAGQSVPAGWSATAQTGDAEACAAYVDAHWTALQPGGG